MLTFASSPRRRPGGGLTIEVQQLGAEDLGWGLAVKAFARGVVVGPDEGAEASVVERGKIGLSRQQ